MCFSVRLVAEGVVHSAKGPVMALSEMGSPRKRGRQALQPIVKSASPFCSSRTRFVHEVLGAEESPWADGAERA